MEDIILPDDVDLMCRLCMTSEGSMETIFNTDLADKIHVLLTFEISDLKGLPRSICNLCKSKLILALDFKMQCLKINVLLMKTYAKSFEEDNQNYILEELVIENLNESDDNELSFNMIEDELIEPVLDKSDTEELTNIKTEPEYLLEDTNIEAEFLKFEEDNKDSNTIIDLNNEFNNEINSIKDKKKGKFRYKKHRKKIVCPICGEMKTKIDVHMATVHAKEKKFICPHCSKGFGTRARLNNHINIHTGNKPYKCKLCVKAFCDPNSLTVHMISTHTKSRNYQCKICEKKFGYNSVLAKHIKTHLEERKYACKYCEKKFNVLEGLKKHERIHTGEKPYACKVCDKRFTSSGNLSSHRKIHTANRPYKCTICQISFSQENMQISHMRKMHLLDHDVKIEIIEAEIVYEDENEKELFIVEQT